MLHIEMCVDCRVCFRVDGVLVLHVRLNLAPMHLLWALPVMVEVDADIGQVSRRITECFLSMSTTMWCTDTICITWRTNAEEDMFHDFYHKKERSEPFIRLHNDEWWSWVPLDRIELIYYVQKQVIWFYYRIWTWSICLYLKYSYKQIIFFI